ncbi:hypothetical protein F511_11812 [Dorcoceras hygrometricum]|uniref:non-specific serine/threonine protein kinase n=1 Tax=Dorcoceras hygrometricum TaxID=472368 RepID=A0A2Z7CDT6_9LAMI|nr:hypothetical protein F511_11812 [Dorcoceras hygrometricum]
MKGSQKLHSQNMEHTAPVNSPEDLENPQKKFHYKELEEATNCFSATNFVAEGEFGLLHRGVLNNGLVIAVKRLKFSEAQREDDFCREVRILSCAPHRNVIVHWSLRYWE